MLAYILAYICAAMLAVKLMYICTTILVVKLAVRTGIVVAIVTLKLAANFYAFCCKFDGNFV